MAFARMKPPGSVSSPTMMQTRAQVPREATAGAGASRSIPGHSVTRLVPWFLAVRSTLRLPKVAQLERLALPFGGGPQGCDGFLPGARFPCLTSLNQTNLGTITPRKTIPIFPSLQVHSQNQGHSGSSLALPRIGELVIIREFVRKASCQQVAQFSATPASSTKPGTETCSRKKPTWMEPFWG